VTVIVGLTLLLAGHCWAASGKLESPEQLARRSERIIHGTVDELESFEPGPGAIATRVGFTNVTMWKGSPATNYKVTIAGGILGDRKVTVVGQPEFRLGQEWVVFTISNPAGQSVLVHPILGALAIHRENGQPLVPGLPREMHEGGPNETNNPRSSDAVSLAELKNRIEKALR
jgi:hypothetical protein